MGFMKKALKITAVAGASYGGFKAFKKYQELKANYDNVYMFKVKENEVEEEIYEGGSYGAMFSVLELDLSEAIIEDDISIDLFGFSSVLSITIPDGCNVELEGTSKKAVIQNEFEEAEAETEEEEIVKIVDELEERPTITINYKLKATVLEVKSKSEEEEEEDTEEVDMEVEGVEVEEVIIEEESDEDGITVDITVDTETTKEPEEEKNEEV